MREPSGSGRRRSRNSVLPRRQLKLFVYEQIQMAALFTAPYLNFPPEVEECGFAVSSVSDWPAMDG
jgi:hypothetical protein